MISSQNSEAARRDGKCFVETKLRGEVCDRILQQLRGVLMTPGFWVFQIRVKIIEGVANFLGELLVLQPRAQFLLRYFVQDGDAVVIKILPGARGKLREDFQRVLVPRAPQIGGQAMQSINEFADFSLW